MAEFKAAVDKLLAIRQEGPGASYTWVVEAVFADPESPGGGMYAQMGVFTDRKTADAFAVELTTGFGLVDFMTFRARPMRPFRPFFDPGAMVLLTDDDKFNEAMLRAASLREKREDDARKREEALKLQEEAEVKVGTNAHVARLVHLCAQNQGQAVFHRVEAERSDRSYTTRLTELKAILAAHPETGATWLAYITPIMERINEHTALTHMSTWWDKNKAAVTATPTLPLPEELHPCGCNLSSGPCEPKI